MTDAILRWANKYTRGHDHVRPVEDYTESWADGLAFCALMHAYFPEKIPIAELKADTRADKLRNLNLAFDVAAEFGAERYLDAEDTVDTQDKKSMMVYLSEVYNKVQEKGLIPKFEASAAWNKKFEETEKQRKFEEWKAKNEAKARGENPDLQIPSQRKATGSIADKWKAAASGQKEAVEEPIPEPEKAPVIAPKSTPVVAVAPKPAVLAAKPAPAPVAAPVKKEEPTSSSSKSGAVPSSPITAEVTGRGAKGGPVNSMTIFSVKLKAADGIINPTKEDLVVHVEHAGSEVIKPSIMYASGSWAIGFKPAEAGQYWFDFVFRGKFAEEPFMCPIDKLKKVPEHAYVGVERKKAASAPPPAEAASNGDDGAAGKAMVKAEQEAREVAEAARVAHAEAEAKERAERAALEAAEKAAVEAELAAAEKAAAEVKAASERAAAKVKAAAEAEEAAAEKAAAERAEKEKAEAARAAAEQAAQEAKEAAERAEREAAEKKAAEKEAAEKAAAEKAAAEKKSREEKEAAERAAAEKAAAEKEAAERKAQEAKEAAERAAAEKKAQEEKAAEERAAAERAAAEKKAQEEKEAAERAAVEKAEQEAKDAERAAQERALSAEKSTARGSGIKDHSDADEGHFIVSIRNQKGDLAPYGSQALTVSIDGPSKVEVEHVDEDDGNVVISYPPLNAGKYVINVLVEGKPIQKSPFNITITEATVGGAIDVLTFTFKARNQKGQPRTSGGDANKFKVTAKGGVATEITDLDNGSYTLDFAPMKGQNTIDVKFDGNSVTGFPLSFKVEEPQ